MDKYITCKTMEQWEKVLKKLGKEGYTWAAGDKATSSYAISQFNSYKSDSVIHASSKKNRLFYSPESYYRTVSCVSEFISATDFLADKTKPILISRKGRVVTAEDKNTGEKGVATCSPQDEFDFKIGAKLALARLWGEEVPKALLNDDEIHEGDTVRITDTGKQYTTYNEWIKSNITNVDLICKFDYNREASRDGEYVVVKLAEHGRDNKTLAYIREKTDLWPRCYLINVKGLEKVTK